MTQPIVQVDAFTGVPFSGNPAAVCLLPQRRNDNWMQQVAREMNVSETAFLVRRDDEECGFDLRWFTPSVEVDLCGHATLASAHVLWETGTMRGTNALRFHTRSGVLVAMRDGDWIALDFPATPDEAVDAPEGLLDAIGGAALYVGKTRFDYLVELADEKTVKNIRPDFARLRRLAARGVIVTSRSDDPEFDFVSRYFAPAFGIDEDPATGSTHCALAPFWRRHLHKDTFVARQVSERGGVVKATVKGDRVLLAGQAVTVLRGELCAP